MPQSEQLEFPYAATSDADGGEIRHSLKHRDRKQAKDYAHEEAKKLRRGLSGLGVSRPTLERVFEIYLRERPRVGPGPLFPGPRNPDKPIRYELASRWLRMAEQKAGVEPHDGSLWHASRRLWASARKELPDADVDVAQAGG